MSDTNLIDASKRAIITAFLQNARTINLVPYTSTKTNVAAPTVPVTPEGTYLMHVATHNRVAQTSRGTLPVTVDTYFDVSD